ncbi:hypothetical protein N0V90_003924 [Kalmusia sp. IMI 367209]|nr:hypothetical protein N0V90_003924 [Kalmusia sp. IMI 367209]
MPIRNPFRRTPGVEVVDDAAERKNAANSGTKPLQIKEPTEYKLSAFANGEAYFLAFQVKYLYDILESPESSKRERALQHFARELRLLPEILYLSIQDARSTASLQEHRPSSADERVPEEGFEDVGLNDEPKPQPKKRSIFSRFGDSHDADAAKEERPASSHHHFTFTGRKRAQSGQGSELKSMSKPSTPQPPTAEAVEAR